MTATAASAAAELKRFYGLDTVIIPPNNPERMEHLPDLVFSTMEAKLDALIHEIDRVHSTGWPILVGTRTVKESQELSERLFARGILHEVLNAKNDEREAALVAQVGTFGAVTISTNMAGRGTDVRLGGPDGADRQRITALGGLYVIGTNRYESVRVDNQLRGRAGRQGDPGMSRFFISLEDDLVVRYAITDFIPAEYIGNPSKEPIPDPGVAREIARAREIIEEQHFQMRTTLRHYTALVEKQRKHLAELRKDAVDNGVLPDALMELCEDGFLKISLSRGDKTARDMLVHIFLRRLDSFWSGYLAWVDHIREGIHLRRLGQEDPLLSFIAEATETFDSGVDALLSETAEEFQKTDPGEYILSAGRGPLRGTASTWTYLVNDNPFLNFKVSLFGAPGASNPMASLGAMVLTPVFFMVNLFRKGKILK